MTNENDLLCIYFSDRVHMNVWMVKVEKSYCFKCMHICKASILCVTHHLGTIAGWWLFPRSRAGEQISSMVGGHLSPPRSRDCFSLISRMCSFHFTVLSWFIFGDALPPFYCWWCTLPFYHWRDDSSISLLGWLRIGEQQVTIKVNSAS